MTYIDPDSPRETGTDCCGHPVRLGEEDHMGHFVGYIDQEGNCWESLRERDEALTTGRYLEAWNLWWRAGSVSHEPDPRTFAERICLGAENIEDAILECERYTSASDPFVAMAWLQMAERARWN